MQRRRSLRPRELNPASLEGVATGGAFVRYGAVFVCLNCSWVTSYEPPTVCPNCQNRLNTRAARY